MKKRLVSLLLAMLYNYLKDNNVNYKICSNLNSLRNLNTNIKSTTQAGKFITIYCVSDEEANKISKDINNIISEKLNSGELQKSDFCELVGDAKIGSTGALYTRYGVFKADFKYIVRDGKKYYFGDVREVPVSKQRHPDLQPNKCPYDLPITFLGKQLSNNPVDIISDWNDGTDMVKYAPILNID